MRPSTHVTIALTSAALVLAAIIVTSPGVTTRANTTSFFKTETRAIETMKIVPADVLGGAYWAPLTGDNSN
jgi:acetaldehyde dehydrogenase (acetylating)